MKLHTFLPFLLLVISCRMDDAGPTQVQSIRYAITDFERVEAEDGINVGIFQGDAFLVSATGEPRDLQDLSLTKSGSTLKVNYASHDKSHHITSVSITMPVLTGVNFSSAVTGIVRGFTQPVARFDAQLSGASFAQLEVSASMLNLSMAEASGISLSGTVNKMDAAISGASYFSGFDCLVGVAALSVSGAGFARIAVSESLSVSASGASQVTHRGSPITNVMISGESMLVKEK